MALIHNYGLYWQRELVFWGRPRVAGHLMGIDATQKKSEPVNFRDQVGIYVLYDDAFNLIYLGQAGRGKGHKLFDRLKSHRTDRLADRWSRFSWFGIRRVLDSYALSKEKLAANVPIPTVLDHVEAVLIETIEPPNNRQGGRFGEAVTSYKQYFDEKNVGIPTEEAIAEIYKKLCVQSP